MMQPSFHDAASGLLTDEAFTFIVNTLLKQALRTQEFLTLVIFYAERASREALVAADEFLVAELARLIRLAVRETDLIGRTADGMLALMLAGIDSERTTTVIDRLNEHFRRHDTASTLHIRVGVATCPAHGIQADELLRHAIAKARATT